MQTHLLRCAAVFAVVGSLWASPAQASDWNGSYVANGQCYCVGTQDSSVRDQMVQTPVGEKTVTEICNKIGEGPLLAKIVGVFNHPVYADPQCGSGPFPASGEPDLNCVGSYEPGADCQPRGPKWRLSSLFPAPAQIVESTPIAQAPDVIETTPAVETVEVLKSAPVINEVAVVETQRVTNGSRYIDPAKFRASTDSEEETYSDNSEAAIVDTVIESETESELVRKARAVAEAEREAARKAKREAERESKREADREAQRVASLEKERQQSAEAAQLREQERIAAENQIAQQQALIANDAERAKLDKKAAAKQAKLDKKAAIAAAKQAKIDAKAQKAEEARLAKAASKVANEESATGSSEVKEGSILIVTENTQDTALLAPISALQLPPGIKTKYDDFEYVQAMPLSYSFGGFGMAVQGSLSAQDKFQLVGRAGIADTYNEVFLGAGYYFTPASASRLTMVATAGFEYGVFNLTAGQVQTDDKDSGVAVSLGSRVAINPMLELQATVGYSSFFDGDVYFLGSGFVHITDQLDITSQFEVGDNNSFGLGIRYYY